MKNTITLVFLIFIVIQIYAVDNERIIIRVNKPRKLQVESLIDQGYDILAYKPEHYIDILGNKTELERLRRQGLSTEIFQTEAEIRENLSLGHRLDGYTAYEGVVSQLETYSIINSEICMLYDIGDSWGKTYVEEGNENYAPYHHEIWALKVSDNPEIDEDEPSIYYFGTHHAREPISLEVCMYILDHVISGYGSDTTITSQVNNTQIWFVPLVNPNGHKIVTDVQDLWWRKNIRDNNNNGVVDDADWEYCTDGVDLNRNYDWQWGTTGTYHDNDEITYCGPEPFSEPEIQAIRDLMLEHHFVAGISYHSYGELVLYPYGYSSISVSPDAAAQANLAQDMAETIASQESGFYTPQPSYDLYSCSGTTDDYAYGTFGTFAYTIELATQFIPPANQVESICENNLEAAMILLDRVNHSTLTGIITDAETELPLVAEIFINNIDDQGVHREPICSNEDFGRYFRLLMPGNYEVEIRKFGYETQSFNIDINAENQSILNAQLQPSETVTLTGTVIEADNGNPISNALIQISPTPYDDIYTSVDGIFILPDFPLGSYTFKVITTNYNVYEEILEINPDNYEPIFELTASHAVSFEYGIDPNWNFSGNADWYLDDQHAWHGFNSIRSGAIVGAQSSTVSLDIDIQTETEISFYKKVSCEDDQYDNYDYFYFAINGEEIERWDGEIDWSQEVYQLSPGFYELSWTYQKDNYVDAGSDCAWIDYVDIPGLTSSDENEAGIPVKNEIISNYPNPFNISGAKRSPRTTIQYRISETGNVDLSIYNLKGQLVKTLINTELEPGEYEITWDGTNQNLKSVASGIYIGCLKKGYYTSSIKLILMK